MGCITASGYRLGQSLEVSGYKATQSVAASGFSRYAPLQVSGVAKEVYDEFSYGGWDSFDLLYTAIGGAVMQIFVWIL